MLHELLILLGDIALPYLQRLSHTEQRERAGENERRRRVMHAHALHASPIYANQGPFFSLCIYIYTYIYIYILDRKMHVYTR